MTPSITLDVDAPRFLTHLPQFFSSLGAALAEMLQNSTRAQATTVDITIARTPTDDAWVLTVADDGPGVADPHHLFTVARTGWDESRVIEPAGMGFFALLGLSDTMTITSRAHDGTGWQTIVPADAFHGASFVVTPLAPDDSVGSGLTVQALLKPEADVSCLVSVLSAVYDPFSWRHAFPLTVHLHRPADQGGIESLTVPPLFDPALYHALVTPVGMLYGRMTDNTEYRPRSLQCTVIWEHRLIRVPVEDVLRPFTARHGSVGDRVARTLADDLVWVLPTDTPVRAQLPERAAVIANTAWHETVAQLVDAVVAAFDSDRVWATVRDSGLALPDVLAESPARPDQVAWRALPLMRSVVDRLRLTPALDPFFVPSAQAWLTWAGYVAQDVTDPLSEEGDWDGDDAEGYYGSAYRLWMKNVPVSADESLAQQFSWHGLWTAVADPDADTAVMTLAVQDLRWGPPDTLVDQWLPLGRARQIGVVRNGILVGTIPWLIETVGEDGEVGLIVADQENRLGYGAEVRYPLPLLIDRAPYTRDVSFWDYVWDGTLDLSDLAEMVTHTALQLWDPQAVLVQAAQDQATRIQIHQNALRREATHLLTLMADQPEWAAALTTLLTLGTPTRS